MHMVSGNVYIESYGCSFNFSDGEAMTGLLSRAGYRIVATPEAADAIILNTCTVKDRTYLNFEKRLAQLNRESEGGGPRVILAGCIPKAYERDPAFSGISAIGPDTVDRVVEVVEAALQGRVARQIRPEPGSSAQPRALLPSIRRNAFVEILPIARGCMSGCTFCQTRLARGRLQSFRPGDILARARQAIDEGVRELWVTAQDTGAYGADCGYPLHRLLAGLCALEGDFQVRLGMTSPCWVWRDLKPMLEVFEHPKLYRFLHVPVQSGSDRVLAAMRRGNTAAEFEQVCRAFLDRFDDFCLMTDVIAGFPTETEEDFQATLDLLERTQPAAVNRSKFSPRPGTAAARMHPLPGLVLSERSHRLEAAVRRLARSYHEASVGLTQRVLPIEHHNRNATMAHNAAYRPVVIPGRWPLGQWMEVQITEAEDFHLCARPLAEVARSVAVF